MIDLRLLVSDEVLGRGARRERLFETTKCRACDRATSERKPYCSEHIDQQPYVRRVMAEVKAREDEVRRVTTSARAGRDAARLVPRSSTVVDDARRYLAAEGGCTVSRLRVLLDVEAEAAASYAKALVRRGIAVWTGPRRDVLELRERASA